MFENLATAKVNETFNLGNLGYFLTFHKGSNATEITGELKIQNDKKSNFYMMLLERKFVLDEKTFSAKPIDISKQGESM